MHSYPPGKQEKKKNQLNFIKLTNPIEGKKKHKSYHTNLKRKNSKLKQGDKM